MRRGNGYDAGTHLAFLLPAPRAPRGHDPGTAVNDSASDLDALCDPLADLLDAGARQRIVERVTRGGRMHDALRRLKTSMAKHGFEGLPSDLGRTVHRLDQRTRQDGFRVLHSWNHETHQFTDDIVPVLMTDYFERASSGEGDPRVVVSILLDYYLLHLLALAAMRAWDTDDPGATLARVTRLLGQLQGPDGSGHQFVADAETLMIYALSQFHPEEHAYDRIITRTRMLPAAQQVAFARVSAAVLGAHLRWGFWLMYERDVARMRDDNVGDYPWLLYSVTTLLRAWSEASDGGERRALAGSLLLGLTADPWAFTGAPPEALEPFAEMHAECRGLLDAHGPQLLEELEGLRPEKDTYAPLSFSFNFPHNALVAVLTMALLEGRPQAMPLNDLWMEEVGGAHASAADKEELARALTEFSRSPERLGYRGALLVAYDPLSALRTYGMTLKALRERLG